jgi:prephenate dehydrogenase
MKRFGHIAIVGTGLIGGSLGLAIKRHKLAKRVTGISRTQKNLATALAIGAIDEGAQSLDAIHGADLIILCLPVREILRRVSPIIAVAGSSSVICDVGSTKGEITAAFAARTSRFVGCHPMAGSEKRGIVNASRSLFDGSLCIVTPAQNTDPAAREAVKGFWGRICAEIAVMKPDDHDKTMALVSHLPHAAAFALANSVPTSLLRFSGRGFRDTTRLAASDAKIWEDIFLTNRRNLITSIDALEKNLRRIKHAIRTLNAPALRRLMKRANSARQQIDL